MDRRTLLASGVVAAGLAGCNTDSGDTDPTDSAPPTPTPDPADAPIAERIDRYRFDLGSGTSPGDPYIEEIHVDFEPSSDAVEVASAVVVGSSSCSRAGLESVLYGKETLQVAITAEAKDHAAAYRPENTSVVCTGDVYAQAYTLRVAFDEGLPNRVVVVEPAGSGEDDDRVGRSNGERLGRRRGRDRATQMASSMAARRAVQTSSGDPSPSIRTSSSASS